MSTAKRVYLDAQKGCGIQIGDWVKITRCAVNSEAGWPNCFIFSMRETVGCTGEVFGISDGGITVALEDGNLWSYPYFILEKVEAPHDAKRRYAITASTDGAGGSVYGMAQASSGLKGGDTVRVRRKAFDHEGGWDGTWNDDINHLIGAIGKVVDDATRSRDGIAVYFEGYGDVCFPYFILEKVDVPETLNT